MDSDRLRYLIGFSHIPGIGRVKLSLLQGYFGDLEKAWHAPVEALKTAGLDARAAEALTSMRAGISLDDELEKLHRYDVRALSRDDPLYPPRLREIYDYPPCRSPRWTDAVNPYPASSV